MSKPTKLVQLKSRSETIVCSALHPEGTWVAYCDQESFRMFSLQVVSSCRYCYSVFSDGVFTPSKTETGK